MDRGISGRDAVGNGGGLRVAMLPLPSVLLLLFHVGSFQFIKRSLPKPLTADEAWTRARNSAAVKDQGGVSYSLVTCQRFRVDPGRIGRTAAFFSYWRRGETAGLAGWSLELGASGKEQGQTSRTE